MASTHKHIRSSTANKRPTTAIADGQIALNTNSTSPGLFFKDSTGATIIKIGPVHVGATAPNVSPAAGGSSGNSTGEIWLDNSLTPVGVKIWNGSAWVNATPIGSTTVQGLLELATDAETQAGSDTARAVTPASLQSKVSDSTSTTSSTTIASSTAVKSAYDLANAALPKSGGTVTGNLEIGNTGSLSFEGATADGFETTIAVTDPTADRTITLPDTTGTVVLNTGAQTVQFGLGAAATPSITFTGDTNTGIYSPGADTLAFVEGGVEAMRIDSSGRLLVGTSSTSATCNALLQTNGGTAGTLILAYGNTSPASGQDLGFISFNDSSHIYNSAIIRAARDGGTWTSGTSMPTRLTFSTTADGASSPTEQMRITNAGKVGIGTTSPSSSLVVSNGGANGIEFGPINGDIFTYNRSTSAYTNTQITCNEFVVRTNGSNERARIDSSGRLLVGTTTARANFFNSTSTSQVQVEGTTNDTASAALIRSSTDNGGTVLYFAKQRGSIGANGLVSSGDKIATLSFQGSDGSEFVEAARIEAEVDGTPGANDMPGRLVFSTTADGASSPTERMRIGANGVVTINSGGVATANQSFVQVINGRSSQNLGYVSADISGNEWHFGRSTSDGYFYVVRQTGTGMYMNTNSWVATSDQRAKQNIADIESSIDVVKALKPSRFNWKSDGTADVGFIAQQVQPLIPEAVVDSGDPEAMLGITQDKLLPFVVKALQEAITKIDAMEARLTALEGA